MALANEFVDGTALADLTSHLLAAAQLR